MNILDEISNYLQQGRMPKVKELVSQALEENIDAKEILENALMAGMGVIGEKFKNNQVFVPEVLVAARAMNAGVEILKPYISSENIAGRGKAVIGTVKGDLHDIGKNLVKIMLEGKGIEVFDLGVDVPSETFIEKAQEYKVDLICCSALLTTTMNEMKNVVDCAEKAGIRDKVKIMIGGAPVTQNYCDSIGADFYSRDAASAAEIAYEVCQQR